MLSSVITVVYIAQLLSVVGPLIPLEEFVGVIPYSVVHGLPADTELVMTLFILPPLLGFSSQYCDGYPLLFLPVPKNIAA